MVNRFLFVAFLVCCITHSYAQTQLAKPKSYYLDSTGDDKNIGTLKNPWKTIQKINSIQLHAGDQLLFRGGQIFKGSLHPDIDSTRSSSTQITISSYGEGKAAINAENQSAIIVENAKFIIVKNLQLIGAGRKDGNSGDGISLTNCNNIKIADLDISGFQKSGVSVYTSSDIVVVNVNAHDNGFAGMSVSGEYAKKNGCRNVYIGYCKADNNPGSPVMFDNQSGNGIIAGYCSNVMIEYCSATNNGWDMPRKGNGPVGIWCFESDSVIIQHCISYRNKTSVGGDDGGGFDLDGGVTNSIIQYCLSYENQGSGFGIFQYAGASPWHNNTIRYNISENDGTVSAAHAGIFIWNSSEDAAQFYNCIFYNNTIYNSNGAAINFAGQSERKGFSFYNNIFVGGDSLLKGKRTDDIYLANNWWSLQNKFYIEGISNFSEWTKKSGQETMQGKLIGLNTDPGFKTPGDEKPTSPQSLKLFNRYKIQKNSTLQQKGIDLQKVYGIKTGGVDLNEKPAPAKGIGASF